MAEIFPCTGYGAARKAGTIVRLRSAPGLDDFVRVDSAIPPFAPDPSMEAEVTQLLDRPTGLIAVSSVLC